MSNRFCSMLSAGASRVPRCSVGRCTTPTSMNIYYFHCGLKFGRSRAISSAPFISIMRRPWGLRSPAFLLDTFTHVIHQRLALSSIRDGSAVVFHHQGPLAGAGSPLTPQNLYSVRRSRRNCRQRHYTHRTGSFSQTTPHRGKQAGSHPGRSKC
jgi:hypothetical protein